MKVSVVRTRRNGEIIPRWQIVSAKPVSGALAVAEEWSADMHRHVRAARLEGLPPLYDPVLLKSEGAIMVLTGFERLTTATGTPVDYVQTWWIKTPDDMKWVDQPPPPAEQPILEDADGFPKAA